MKRVRRTCGTTVSKKVTSARLRGNLLVFRTELLR